MFKNIELEKNMDGWKMEFPLGLFSGAILVLGRVKNKKYIYLFCKCFAQLCMDVAMQENVCVCVHVPRHDRYNTYI